MNIVLVAPEIPQNTGNIARTCAALAADLHLVHPLGFSVDDRSLRRAGLDYWHLLAVHHYASLHEFLDRRRDARMVFYSSTGAVPFSEVRYPDDCYLVFGNESRGLPNRLLASAPGEVVRIPTVSDARCLNLSNAVAVAAYEVARQHAFAGLQTRRTRPDPAARD